MALKIDKDLKKMEAQFRKARQGKLGISLFNAPSLYAVINLPVRRDGFRVTQDWFNDIRDALLGGVVSPTLTGIVVGDATDVANGDAVYSSIQAAHDAATTTDQISLLARTWTENVTWSKELIMIGKGSKSILNGNLTIATGSNRSSFRQMFFKESVTIQAGIKGIIISDCFGEEAKPDLVDNSGVTEANFWYIQR